MNISKFSFFFLHLVDVDSTKLDLSQELTNDFSNSFNNLLDSVDLQLNPDVFVSRNFVLLIDYDYVYYFVIQVVQYDWSFRWFD